MENDIILKMNGISKAFPGVQALEDVSLTVKRGTALALMGENGAGKSTLMKILIGMIKADSGSIIFDGKALDTSSVNSVLHQGLSMIHQELTPMNNMSVAENIFAGREPYKIKPFLINMKKMRDDTTALFERLGIRNISARALVGTLSVSKKQMLEIAKAVSYDSKLIIMDEPTSAITESECENLFRIIRELKEKHGISFIFITHKMDEVFKIADEVTVFRDGRYVGSELIGNLTRDKLVYMMVGREIKNLFPKEDVEIGEKTLEIRNLTLNGVFKDISFYVKKGEILGFAGLMGAGRTEVLETVFGYRKADGGEIFLNGKKISISSPKDAIKNKIAFLTEDRKKTGTFSPLSVRDNLVALMWKKLKKGPVISVRKANTICNEEIKKFNIKTPNLSRAIMNLSGGNQQKVLVSRWLLQDPDVLILDEPTRGIDVGTKAEIHRLMTNMARSGKSIIMISSELPEVLSMSDRIIVMREGVIMGIVDRQEATQENLMMYATGLLKNEANN